MSKKRAEGFKQLACKGCGNIVYKVDIAADAITCSDCVQRELNGGYSMTEAEYFAAIKAGKLATCKSEEEE
jgi:ribosomal protein S27E